MTKFSVDSGAVSAAAQRVQSSVSTIQSEVSSLMNQLIALQSDWSGTAADSFSEVIRQWQTTQQQVESSLNSIQVALSRTANIYQETEQQISSQFRFG